MDKKDGINEKTDKQPNNLQNSARPLSVGIDVEKYQCYLDDVDISDEQKKELLEALWMIMRTFIDIGFGIHPMQQALPEQDKPICLHQDSKMNKEEDSKEEGKGA